MKTFYYGHVHIFEFVKKIEKQYLLVYLTNNIIIQLKNFFIFDRWTVSLTTASNIFHDEFFLQSTRSHLHLTLRLVFLPIGGAEGYSTLGSASANLSAGVGGNNCRIVWTVRRTVLRTPTAGRVVGARWHAHGAVFTRMHWTRVSSNWNQNGTKLI